MNHQQLIFWSGADTINLDHVANNVCLMELSRTFRFVVACSGNSAEYVADKYGDLTEIVECENFSSKKANAVIRHIRSKAFDYDFLIRLDFDTIIFDLDRLVQLISPFAGGMYLIGWKRKNSKHKWIRGGCNATTKAVVDHMPPLEEVNERRFLDEPYYAAVRKTAATVIDMRLFEQNDSYSGTCPAWHPKQQATTPANTNTVFKRHIKQWKAGGERPLSQIAASRFK